MYFNSFNLFDFVFWNIIPSQLDEGEVVCRHLMKKFGITRDMLPTIADKATRLAEKAVKASECPFEELTEIIVCSKFKALITAICEKNNLAEENFIVEVKTSSGVKVYYKGELV